jgi:hypothetical protein
LADGMFSPIVAWLSGEASCNANDFAEGLRTTSRTMLAGILRGVEPSFDIGVAGIEGMQPQGN